MAALHKLVKEHNNGEYYAAMTEKEAARTVLVDLENNKAYTLELPFSVIESIAKSHDKSLSEIQDWCFKAFSSNDSSSSQDVFSIDDSNHLTWKKLGGKMKLKIAELPLKSMSSAEAHKKIFGHALNTIKTVTKRSERYKENFEHLADEHKGYQTRMNDMTLWKENLESKLYNEFLTLLHSKQDCIRDLKEENCTLRARFNLDDEEHGSAVVKHQISSSEDETETEPKRSRISMDDSQDFFNST